jgi:LysM repeat protein
LALPGFLAAALAALTPLLIPKTSGSGPLPHGRDRFRRLAVWTGLCSVGALILAGLAGAAAVLADGVWGASGSFATVRAWLAAGVSVGAAGVFPLVAMTAVAAASGGRTSAEDLKGAIRRLPGAYPSLLVLYAAGCGAGYLAMAASAHVGPAWLAAAVRALTAVVVGAGILIGLFRICWRRLPPQEAPSWPEGKRQVVRKRALAGVAGVAAAALMATMSPDPAAARTFGSATNLAGPREALDIDFTLPEAVTKLANPPEPDDPPLKDPEPYYPVAPAPQGEVVAVDDGSVTYQTSAKTFTTAVGGVKSAYVDKDGDIQLVDNTLQPVTPAGGEPYLTNASNEFDAVIPAEVSKDHGLLFSRQGFTLELLPVDGDYSRPVAQDNAVLYNSVFEGVDVQYTLVGGVVKEDIVLNQAQDRHEFAFDLKPGSGLRLALEDGAVKARATKAAGGVEKGEVVFAVSAPVMMDAAGALSDAVSLDLVQGSGSPRVTVQASQDWLEDTERAYPVRIDPTIDLVPSAVTLVGVEQGSPDVRVGDNGFPYSGYDDGVVSRNIELYDTAHLMTRTYVGINYNFASLMEEAKINSAVFSLHHYTDWSNGATNFGLYQVNTAWNPNSITWNNQLSSSHTFIASSAARPNGGWLSWDVRELVNNWVQGIGVNRGLVVKALNERNMQAEVFSNKNSGSLAPTLVIDWEVPDPVDPNLPLDSLTVDLFPMTEQSLAGKQIFDAVFAAGLATPLSQVDYQLKPEGADGSVEASKFYKYPNSEPFESTLPEATRYRDKLGNWQSGLFGGLAEDQIFNVEATATKESVTSTVKSSDKFLIYKVKQRDTYPYIAKYYGVPLDTIMRDNRVQDTLVVDNNTLFIRNPKTAVPYNPPPLTEDQKRQIDSALMGRGLHCEYGYEPVNFNTGNFWMEAVDVTIPEIEGDFAVTRSYNSKGDGFQSMFGRNWEFGYAESLSLLEDGTVM